MEAARKPATVGSTASEPLVERFRNHGVGHEREKRSSRHRLGEDRDQRVIAGAAAALGNRTDRCGAVFTITFPIPA